MIFLSRALPVVVLAAALFAQQSDTSTFQASAKLVLVPFSVARGKYLAGDLQPSDVILRENGRPRTFTVFEGPNTPNALPLEMILLFDSSKYSPPKGQKGVHSYWEAKAAYEFLNDWDEPTTRAILEKNGMDIRISVYHYADRQLERLSNATRNPSELLQAFRRLLDPIPAGQGILTLLPGSRDFSVPTGGSTLFSSAWLWESIVASLKDATAASPGSARRVLFVFSEGYSGTGGTPQIVADAALVLGVPIYPVILDRNKYVEHPMTWTNVPGVGGTEVQPPSPDSPIRYVPAPPASRLGDMTDGGVYFPAHLDRKRLQEILEGARDAELAKYFVSFVPEPSQPPRKRKLEVVLRSKSLGKLVGGWRDASY